MPSYLVTDPSTGRKVKLTGDSPPTEQELEGIFAGLPPVREAAQPEPRTQTALPAPVAEAAGAINRGVAAIPDFFSDAINAGASYLPEPLSSGFTRLTEPLRAIAGQEGTGIPRAADVIEDATGGTRNFMEPGLARTVVQEGGEFLPAAASLATAARKVVPTVAENASNISRTALRPGVNPQTEAAVTGGSVRVGNTSSATQKISPAGKIIEDVAASSSIKQGFDPGTIAAVKASSSPTKVQMKRMVNTLEQGLNNKRFAVQNRPSDVVGDAVGRRITTITRVNRRAGQRLDHEAKKLAGEKLDFSPSVQGFLDDLKDMGVAVDDNLKPAFEGSDIEGIAGAERIITAMLRRAKTVGDDALQGHRLKRYIDENVSFGKITEGLSGKAERVVKRFRHNIDGQLDETFDTYREVNEQFSETRGVLDSFQEAAGRIDLTGPNSEKAIGTLSRRLMSNVQSRVRLLNSIEGLDDVAAKYGAKVDDDILTLALFADELDSVFKPVARTSLGGELAKAAVTEGKGGILREAASRGFDAARGVNEKAALSAIREVLNP